MSTMSIRANDSNNDWQFGQGRNDYKVGEPAIEQNLGTSLQCWLNDCFWQMNFGIDWQNLLGSRSALAAQNIILQCRQMIVSSFGVVKINSVSSSIDARTRKFSVQYDINDIFSRNVSANTVIL